MTPERYARICELFDKAVVLPLQERSVYLGAACGDDAALQAEVFDFLAQDELGRGENRFEPPFRLADDFAPVKGLSHDPNVGRRIGPYVLQRLISSGGMGSVYLAVRVEDFQQQAAIKLIKGGFDSEQMVLRFRHERQVLAALNHPNIAHLLDGGATENGEPFFVMEYIEGEPLDRYCDNQRLKVRERLKLFTTICTAIQYAHQRAVIHRDLKPGNILVAQDGQPKVLDFGIARVSDPNLKLTGLATEAGQPIGTLAYMSPEQAAGDPLLDVRSDVYTLGVICYELLTGRLPYDLEDRALGERLRIIAEQAPTPLRSVNPAFPGDLDTILARALEKDRDRRYRSAGELADDVERFLTNRPILARPPSKWYQFRKFARRNKALVGGVAATLLAIVFGSLGTAWYATQAVARGKQTQQLLAKSYADAASIAVQRGQWKVALENYDRALEAGFPDTIALRLNKAKALFAVNQIEGAEREAAALQRDGAPGHEAELMLLRGDLLLGRDNERALPLLRQALNGGLPEKSDEEYARAFLAATSPQAVEHLRRAVMWEPAHPRAGQMLVVMLALLGKFTDAQTQLAAVRAFYPKDQNLLWLQAMLHIMRGDFDAARSLLDTTRGRWSEEDRQALLASGEVLRALHDANLADGEFLALFNKLGNARTDSLLHRLGMRKAPDSKEEFAGALRLLPLPPVLYDAFTQFAQGLHQATTGGNKKNAIAALEHAVRIHPEGTLYYLLSLVHFSEGRLAEAEGPALRAVELEGVLPVRARALFVAATVQGYLGSPKRPSPDLKKRKRAVENLRKVLQYGPLRQDQYEIGVKVAWNAGEVDLACSLLAEWERKRPNDVGPHLLRAEIEWSAGGFAAACQAAQKVLHIQPPVNQATVEAMQRMLRDAPAKMREQITGLPVARKPEK